MLSIPSRGLQMEGTKQCVPVAFVGSCLTLYGEKWWCGGFVQPPSPPPTMPMHSIETGPKPSSSGWQSCFLFSKLNPAQIWINDGTSLQPQIHMLRTDSHLDFPY